MPYEVNCNSKLRIVEATVLGVLSAEEFHSCTDEQLNLSAKHGIGSVLINTLELTSAELVMDIYDLPGRYEDGGLSRSSRFALVLPKLRSLHGIVEFYDNVCNNRGWRVQSFATRDEAIAWLTND
jgi:hypothetical protein